MENVVIGLGEPHDPRLPAGSLDIAILVHMYHEIGFGKAAAGVPDPAINSCAETTIVNAAAKTAAVAICITTPT